MRVDLQHGEWPKAPLRRPRNRVHAQIVLAAAALTILISIGMCVAAVLAPAPPAVLPLVVVVCVGCPVLFAWEAPAALALVRSRRTGGRAVAKLRRSLDQLPETEHPLGL